MCMPLANSDSLARRAMTVVELLVCVTIVGILASILIPAVSLCRESARKSNCANNLRQIGLSVQSIQDSAARKPGSRLYEGDVFFADTSSFQARLMPHLEQSWIVNTKVPRIFAREAIRSNRIYVPFDGFDRTRIAVFHCPSDNFSEYGINYRVCTGPDAHDSQNAVIAEGGRGPFVGDAKLRNSGMRGLSQLVLMSERLKSIPLAEVDNRRDVWFAGFNGSGIATSSFLDASIAAIEHEPSTYFRSCGHSWYSRLAVFAAYNHVLPPNDRSKTSLVANVWGGTARSGDGYIIGATSNHAACVAVLRGDSSVGFVADSVDPQIWRELATAN